MAAARPQLLLSRPVLRGTRLKVHALIDRAPSDMELALAEFERQFWYPLGPDSRFCISHCGEYGLFFRAMGEAACFVAERDGQVLGVLGTAVRRLIQPGGVTRKVGYIGDLKIAPGARGGLVLARLARAAFEWLSMRVDAAVGIAMDGTPMIPTSYTGRAGVPPFERVGQVTILSLPATASAPELSGTFEAAAGAFERFSRGRYALPAENASLRSEMAPIALVNSGACGVLEDTRKAKRLFTDRGVELKSAHLSTFAYDDAGCARELLWAALAEAQRLGFEAVFVAADVELAVGLQAQVATATIFAANLGPGDWIVNTAEI